MQYWFLACLLGVVWSSAVQTSLVSGPQIQSATDRVESFVNSSRSLVVWAEKHHCEDIHEAEDRCEYAQLYCSPESAGMVDYIKWYYCDMSKAQPLAFSILVVWTSLLFSTIGIASSDFFCPNLATIANSLGMSQSVAGVTFLAFGNGSPDVFSTFAAFKAHSGSLAIGELLGAAAFITSVVAGVMAIIAPFKVSRRSFLRDAGFLLIAVLITMILLADGQLRLWESILMIVFYGLYVAFVLIGTYVNSTSNRKKVIESRIRSRYETANVRSDNLLPGDDLDDDTNRLLQEDRVGIEHLEGSDSDDDSEDGEYPHLHTSMSITGRPMLPSRNSVRPSLLGALEFRELVAGLAEDGNLSPAAIHAIKKRPRAHSTICRPPASHFSSSRKAQLEHNQQVQRHSRSATHRPGGAHFQRQSSLPDRLIEENGELIPPSSSISIQSQSRPSSPTASEEPLANADIASTSLRLHEPIELLSPSIPVRTTTSPVPPIVQIEGVHLQDDEDHSFIKQQSASLLHYEATASIPSVAHGSNSDLQASERTIGSEVIDCECGEVWSPVWWPTAYLPAPRSLANLLFPTLHDFKTQTHVQRLLSILATPSVFVLTLTLPVVNPPVDQKEAEINEEGRDLEAVVAKDDTERYTAHQGWNRWLACLQCLLTPQLVTFIVFYGEVALLIPLLCSTGVSFVLLALTLLLTRADARPRFHTLLCFVGFAISVCWISTIANEVVGTLQAFGTILGLSDAILGLTVFAVGNSLGDFVADVTVARMGFSQMAISGVFGGPMLNILLGIGISGIYINVSKHHVYNTQISPTLIVSGASLLTTLVMLLIAVPANDYVMSRKLGFILCGVFLSGMICSILVEIYVQS